MTLILGISAFYHDSAAALVATARSSPRRRRSGSRGRSTTRLSRTAPSTTACTRPGCTLGDLDYVGFYEKPLAKFERLLRDLPRVRAARLSRRFRQAMPLWLEQKLHMPRELDRGLRRRVPRAATRSPIITSRTPPARSSRRRSRRRRSSRSTASASGRPRAIGVGRGNRHRADARAALPAFARPALLGLHLLHRLQGQQRRVQADGARAVRRAALRRRDPAST